MFRSTDKRTRYKLILISCLTYRRKFSSQQSQNFNPQRRESSAFSNIDLYIGQILSSIFNLISKLLNTVVCFSTLMSTIQVGLFTWAFFVRRCIYKPVIQKENN